MCIVETARGCWGYLCQECQENSIAKDERIRKLEAALREIDAEFAHKHRNDRQWALWMKDRARAALAGQEAGREK